MKNGTLLCDVTMTLMRQEKIGNIFFLKQHICFLKKMNINHFYPEMHTAAQISTKRPALYRQMPFSMYQHQVTNKYLWLKVCKTDSNVAIFHITESTSLSLKMAPRSVNSCITLLRQRRPLFSDWSQFLHGICTNK